MADLALKADKNRGTAEQFAPSYFDKYKNEAKRYGQIAGAKAKKSLTDFGQYAKAQTKSGIIDFGQYAKAQAKKGVKNIGPYTMQKLDEARYFYPKANPEWNSFWGKGFCTDGRNDGIISLSDKGVEFGKGLLVLPQKAVEGVPKAADYGLSFAKAAFDHPIRTLVLTATLGGLAVSTGGIMLPAIATIAGGYGCYKFGKSIINAKISRSDFKTKDSYREMGQGAAVAGAACLGANSALSIAKSSGLKISKLVDKDAAPIVNCIKCTPASIKESLSTIFKVTKNAYHTGRVGVKSGILATRVLAFCGRTLSFGAKAVAFPFKPVFWLLRLV